MKDDRPAKATMFRLMEDAIERGRPKREGCPRVFICRNEFLSGSLFEGKAYSKGGLFQSLAFFLKG